MSNSSAEFETQKQERFKTFIKNVKEYAYAKFGSELIVDEMVLSYLSTLPDIRANMLKRGKNIEATTRYFDRMSLHSASIDSALQQDQEEQRRFYEQERKEMSIMGSSTLNVVDTEEVTEGVQVVFARDTYKNVCAAFFELESENEVASDYALYRTLGRYALNERIFSQIFPTTNQGFSRGMDD